MEDCQSGLRMWVPPFRCPTDIDRRRLFSSGSGTNLSCVSQLQQLRAAGRFTPICNCKGLASHPATSLNRARTLSRGRRKFLRCDLERGPLYSGPLAGSWPYILSAASYLTLCAVVKFSTQIDYRRLSSQRREGWAACKITTSLGPI